MNFLGENMEILVKNRLARIFSQFAMTHEVTASRPSDDKVDVIIHPNGHEVKGHFVFEKSEDSYSAGFVQWMIHNEAERKIIRKVIEDLDPAVGITERIIKGDRLITYLTHYYLSNLTDTEIELRYMDTIGRAAQYNHLLREYLSHNKII
jgi:hypothetical protein